MHCTLDTYTAHIMGSKIKTARGIQPCCIVGVDVLSEKENGILKGQGHCVGLDLVMTEYYLFHNSIFHNFRIWLCSTCDLFPRLCCLLSVPTHKHESHSESCRASTITEEGEREQGAADWWERHFQDAARGPLTLERGSGRKGRKAGAEGVSKSSGAQQWLGNQVSQTQQRDFERWEERGWARFSFRHSQSFKGSELS